MTWHQSKWKYNNDDTASGGGLDEATRTDDTASNQTTIRYTRTAWRPSEETMRMSVDTVTDGAKA